MLESPDRQTETPAIPTPAVVSAVLAEEPPAEAFKKKGIGVVAWFAIVWLSVITFVAFLAPWLPIKDPNGPPDYLHIKAGPFTSGHLLGTDDIGLDVLSRVIWGARASLLIGVFSVLFGVLIGGLLGLIAGYVGGRWDGVLSSGFNILLAFPPLILALTLVSVLAPADAHGGAQFGHRVMIVIISVGIVSVPLLARITRANTLSWSQREFVMAARSQGAKPTRVMFREVLPNVLPAMVSIALLGIAIVIVIEGGLALFGLSVPLPDPSWGNMIAGQITDIEAAPQVWIAPSVCIFLTVLSLNYLSDVIRAKFDVRESVL
jgi:peptide/nickel transport system permease protein